jgi:hypothetical protein
MSIMAPVKIASIVLLVALLAACASSGFYDMSDEWCAGHVSASAARCPGNPQQVAANESERVANNAARGNN